MCHWLEAYDKELISLFENYILKLNTKDVVVANLTRSIVMYI